MRETLNSELTMKSDCSGLEINPGVELLNLQVDCKSHLPQTRWTAKNLKCKPKGSAMKICSFKTSQWKVKDNFTIKINNRFEMN